MKEAAVFWSVSSHTSVTLVEITSDTMHRAAEAAFYTRMLHCAYGGFLSLSLRLLLGERFRSTNARGIEVLNRQQQAFFQA